VSLFETASHAGLDFIAYPASANAQGIHRKAEACRQRATALDLFTLFPLVVIKNELPVLSLKLIQTILQAIEQVLLAFTCRIGSH